MPKAVVCLLKVLVVMAKDVCEPYSLGNYKVNILKKMETMLCPI